MNTENKTFDLIFDDDIMSNNKGFTESLEYCRNYIKHNTGTNFSYFEDYKNGTVSIYCNETSEIVEVYSCKDGSLLESKINA